MSRGDLRARLRTIWLGVFVFLCLLIAAPRTAMACPVCFGQSDSPMATAAKLGVIAMLVVVAGMIGAFATFFIYLIRRAKLVAAQEASEGTAQ